jgi:hypothetical protein
MTENTPAEISVSSPPPVSSAIPAVETHSGPGRPGHCEACGAPLNGRRGQRYCNAACRLRAHRGAVPVPHREPAAKALSRDETVSRLCYALKTHEGLRDGLDVLVRIVEDERARLQAMPLYARQQIAKRFLAGLGLKQETEA